MNEIKCPKCGEIFKIDEAVYNSIVSQVKDKEFKKQIQEREDQFKAEKATAVEKTKLEVELNFREKLSEKELEIQKLQSYAESAVAKALSDKEKEIAKLKGKIDSDEKDYQLRENSLIKKYEEQIAQYKDFKAKQSVKLLGENLEQHCEIEFNKWRALGFQNAYFEKDNDIRTGSKGDYIFRELDDDGSEVVSIMFEMKNEADTTATKKKNEDFFKELDKDRKEKKCEYAVLVTMLEADNELYNSGIVDVSYKFPKMYVIRPQFFIPMITLLKNAALRSLEYKKALVIAQNQNIDITNFERDLNESKDKVSRNVRLANEKFQSSIDEIDKTIAHLNKVKEGLLSTANNLRLASDKVESLSIKSLTKNNPTMLEKFNKLKNEE